MTKNLDIQNDIINASNKIKELKNEIAKKIVWQSEMIDSLLIWLFAEWHILVEWVPWLAKTLTIDTLSKTLDLWFNRIQFTPDLLPSDLIGTEIYNSKTMDFDIKKWPIFNNFILADEINRAPSKVQSALLEAMSEKQVTIWKNSFILDKPFIVLATQNPIEQTWTYKLPEAQLDRFMLKVNVDYPSYDEEKEMYKKILWSDNEKLNKIMDKKDIFLIQDLVKKIFISESIFDYVTNIVDATRNPSKYNIGELETYISYWASPRAWLSLLNASRFIALMNERSFVIPEDIKKIATLVLSHRIVLSYEAMASEKTEKDIIKNIIEKINIV